MRWVLALLIWFSCAWFGSWEGNPNNATRLFAAISLVEDGDATIDEFAPLTIDKAQFGGHFYLDKAPGMTLMALPAVAIANKWTGERSASVSKLPGSPDMARFLRLRLRLAAATGPALLTALAAVLLFDLALGLTGSAAAALAASLAFSIGSPVWGWSTTIFGHAPVAALYMVALWALWRASGPGVMALAGAALGWAVVIEYQAVLAGAVLALFGAWQVWSRPERWRLLGAAVAGGVVAMLPMIGYNLVAFGTMFKLGYQGVVGFEGMNRGLFGLGWPSPAVLWAITFGTMRGLLWVAPVLALGAFGLTQMGERHRMLAWTIGTAAAIVLLVNAAYFYWDGGNSTGPRHATPAIGLLALGLAPLWAGLTTKASRIAAAVALALSIGINLVIAACDIFAPPIDPWPLHWVMTQHLLLGDVTSIAGDWWGWPESTGLVVWAAVALPALAWLARVARLHRHGPAVSLL
ncbi:hypothetical protein [Sphingomonas sp.]|jgi:hypothetical protein|uniref:hypothetical protein n=1 Tax=Sphingomonas sp. TaxID=28214 RepID=UPI002D80C591|nr:hypothetical protein [Sphingomonas sp.]